MKGLIKNSLILEMDKELKKKVGYFWVILKAIHLIFCLKLQSLFIFWQPLKIKKVFKQGLQSKLNERIKMQEMQCKYDQKRSNSKRQFKI